jgi:magnesium transporter
MAWPRRCGEARYAGAVSDPAAPSEVHGKSPPAHRRRRHRRRRKPPVGSTPGALATPHGEPPPKLQAMWYDAERQGERALSGAGEIAALLADATLTTWIDIEGLGNLDVLREIGQLIDLHPLALADVVNVPQRPKVEMYGERLLFVGHMAFLKDNGDIEMEQISIVLGPHWVVSFQEKPGDVFEPVRERIRSPQMRIRRMKADFLVYALVDAIVDGYFAVIEKLGNDLDALEDEVMERPTRATLERIHAIRRQLLQLHRLQWRQRDAIASLWRDESFPIGEPVRVYLRDVYDHAFEVLDTIETFRDLSVSLMDVYLSAASNRMNEVMTTLTLVATVFIPLTFVVGVYGMNFDVMPELRWRFGYPLVWAFMVALGAGILLWFRRKRWL